MAAAAAAPEVKNAAGRQTAEITKQFKIEIDSSIWREEIQNRNRHLDIDSSIWHYERGS